MAVTAAMVACLLVLVFLAFASQASRLSVKVIIFFLIGFVLSTLLLVLVTAVLVLGMLF